MLYFFCEPRIVIILPAAPLLVDPRAAARDVGGPGAGRPRERLRPAVSGGDGLLPGHNTSSPGIDGEAAEESRALQMAAARIRELTEKGGPFEPASFCLRSLDKPGIVCYIIGAAGTLNLSIRASGGMADTLVLGTSAFGRESSSLSWPTNN